MTEPSDPISTNGAEEPEPSDLLGVEAPDDDAPLDFAGRKLLEDVKADVLGTPPKVHHIGRFRVLAEIGRGAMGTVYEADDAQLGRKVALKLLHSGVGATDHERGARLRREARVLARLSHPNIIQVFEVGEHNGQVFMVMELVRGRTLDRVQAETLSTHWQALLDLYLMAGRGLAAAHAKNIVHRDFKPHNVIVDEAGTARVVDFGLARGPLEDAEPTVEVPACAEGAIERARPERLTASGDNPGTPRFMAPELFAGHAATAASDQYSFCLALYFAVYGQYPFPRATWQDLLAELSAPEVWLPPEAQSVRPRWLASALRRGLAPNPEARFPSLEDLFAELAKDRRRARRGALAAVALSAVVGTTWWARGRLGVDPDVLEAQQQQRIEAHRMSCRQRADRMRTAWDESAVRGAPSRGSSPSMRDVEVRQFVETWEGSCLADTGNDHERCRTFAAQTFDALLVGEAQRPPSDAAFYTLAHELELCMEPRSDTGRCNGPRRDSTATMALAKARAAYELGDLDSALRLTETARVQAQQADDTWSQVGALLQRGAIHEEREELAAARAALDEGLVLATRCDLEQLMVDLGLERLEVESLHAGRETETGLPLALVGGLLERPALDGLLLHRARFHMKEGTVRLNLEGRCAEALAAFEKARSLLERAVEERRADGRPTDVAARLAAGAKLDIANVHSEAFSALSSCETPLSKVQILDLYRDARSQFAEAAGEQHLGLAGYEFDEAATHFRFGDPKAAIEHFDNARRIYLEHLEPENPLIGDVHRGLSAAYTEVGDLDAAVEHARTSLRLRLGWAGRESDPLLVAEAHSALGIVLIAAHELDEAAAQIEAAIDVLRSSERPATGLEAGQLALDHLNLARVRWLAGDVDATEDALASARRWLGDDPSSAPPLLHLLEARVLRTRGDHQGALEALSVIGKPDTDADLELRWERVLLTQAQGRNLVHACGVEVPSLLSSLASQPDYPAVRELRSTLEHWQHTHCQ